MKSSGLLTIKDILARSAGWLKEKGVESARLDAEILLGHVLEMERLQLYLAWDRPVGEKEKEEYRALLRRRAGHEPVAYITGQKEFFGLRLRVTRDVLIPRPETELLVERVLEILRVGLSTETETETETPAEVGEGGDEPSIKGKMPMPQTEIMAAPLIADVGSGSGAIAVALAHELPGARLIATDVSGRALEIARENAITHEVADRIDFRNCSLLEEVEGPLDFVVSNPPYVAEKDRAILPDDVALFEPSQALFGGVDGLDVIRQLIPEAAARLSEGGWLVMEIGIGQGEEVARLMGNGGFEEVEVRKDYAGIDRVVSGKVKIKN